MGTLGCTADNLPAQASMVGGGGGASSAMPAGGGGGSAQASPASRVCDGTTRERLRAFIEPQLAREVIGASVQVENGYPSLAIDGLCSYVISGGWIDDASGRDRGWRSGTVDPSLEAELDDTFSLEHLDELQDCVSAAGRFDQSTRTFRAEQSRASCQLGGPRFEAAWNAIYAAAADLWARGTPLGGAVRLSTLDQGGTDVPYEWPLPDPLSSFFGTQEGSVGNTAAGTSYLIDDPGQASALRALREHYLSDKEAAPGLHAQGLRATDGVTTATVFMRDALPYEDAHGLLPFSD